MAIGRIGTGLDWNGPAATLNPEEKSGRNYNPPLPPPGPHNPVGTSELCITSGSFQQPKRMANLLITYKYRISQRHKHNSTIRFLLNHTKYQNKSCLRQPPQNLMESVVVTTLYRGHQEFSQDRGVDFDRATESRYTHLLRCCSSFLLIGQRRDDDSTT